MPFEVISVSYWHMTEDGAERRHVTVRTSDAGDEKRAAIVEQMEMFGQRAGTVCRGESWYVFE